MHVVPLPWRLDKPHTAVIGASSVAVGPFGSDIQAILVVATADCHIVVGQTPTATNAMTLIRAGFPPLIFRVAPGESLAVIEDSTGGTLYVTELTH